MLPITAFLPVYHRVPVAQFERALESLLWQTRPATQIIIAVDGPVPDDLAAAVRAADESDATIEVLWLPENRGAGVAMQRALERSTQRWFARQDADDVSLPHRFETLWHLLETGRYAAVGGAMNEFEHDETNVVGTRRLPTDPDAARAYARINNPINNPTSIVDGERARRIGGVRDIKYMEDYDLVARLIGDGGEIANTDEVVVLFRADAAMFARRKSKALIEAEWQIQRTLLRAGIVSRPRAIANWALRSAFRALPTAQMRQVYTRLFHRGDADAPGRAEATGRSDAPGRAEAPRRADASPEPGPDYEATR